MEEDAAPNKAALQPSAWVDRHGDFLYAFALSRLRNQEAAEEAVQDALVAALGAVHQFRGKGSERAWLLGILKRKIIDLIRQRNRDSRLEQDQPADDCLEVFDRRGHWRSSAVAARHRPLDTLERQDFWRVFRDCLQALPVRQADAFVLREMDEQSTEEICKDLEITASNFWVLLYRARLGLSRCMKTRWQQGAS